MPKILGTIDANGFPVFPETSISGRPYRKPAIMRNVPGGFVVMDADPVVGFDYDAAFNALGAPQVVGAPEFVPLSKQEAAALAAGHGMSVNTHTSREAALSFLAQTNTPVSLDTPVAVVEATDNATGEVVEVPVDATLTGGILQRGKKVAGV